MSHSVGCLFILWMVTFAVKKLFSISGMNFMNFLVIIASCYFLSFFSFWYSQYSYITPFVFSYTSWIFYFFQVIFFTLDFWKFLLTCPQGQSFFFLNHVYSTTEPKGVIHFCYSIFDFLHFFLIPIISVSLLTLPI